MLSRQVRRLPYRAAVRALATAAPGQDRFANGTNAYYAEEMYRAWKEDPKSVHVSWDAYFKGLDKGLGASSFAAPPAGAELAPGGGGLPSLFAEGGTQLDDHLKVCLSPTHELESASG